MKRYKAKIAGLLLLYTPPTRRDAAASNTTSTRQRAPPFTLCGARQEESAHAPRPTSMIVTTVSRGRTRPVPATTRRRERQYVPGTAYTAPQPFGRTTKHLHIQCQRLRGGQQRQDKTRQDKGIYWTVTATKLALRSGSKPQPAVVNNTAEVVNGPARRAAHAKVYSSGSSTSSSACEACSNSRAAARRNSSAAASRAAVRPAHRPRRTRRRCRWRRPAARTHARTHTITQG